MKLNLGEISGQTKLTAKVLQALEYLTAKTNDATIIAGIFHTLK
jgi:hypothetical protein